MKLQTELPVTIPCNLNKSFEREGKSYIYRDGITIFSRTQNSAMLQLISFSI